MKIPKQADSVLRVRVPFELSKDVGLGDVIKNITSTVGARPCGKCEQRAAYLNQRVVFTGKRNS